ncbi:MAG: homocysteine S-methyltransferase, partial [Calditrichales bacterium]
MQRTSLIQPFLDNQGVIILDGGLATELERKGYDLRHRLWSARLLIDRPDAIRAVHRSFLEAGADCIITASYQASVAGL